MGQLSTLLKNIWNSLHFVVYKIFRPGSVDKNHLTYIDKVRQDWRARGFSCDLWTDPPGQVWNNFVHPTDELVIVLEGEMEFELEGKKNHPKMHEEVLSVRNRCCTGMTVLLVNFVPGRGRFCLPENFNVPLNCSGFCIETQCS